MFFLQFPKIFKYGKCAPKTENMPKNLENMENVHNFFLFLEKISKYRDILGFYSNVKGLITMETTVFA
jgi:hypothetical protein